MFKQIAEHFIKRLLTSDNFNSANPVKDTALLFPAFWEKLQKSIVAFNVKYPAIKVVFVETYRSNDLQLQHYKNGASQIKKDGMHHFGIAADLAFMINGKFSYNGDYKYLRACHETENLTILPPWDIGHVQFIPVSKQQDLRNEVYSAVKQFQKENGLIPDGIPGQKTISKAKQLYL